MGIFHEINHPAGYPHDYGPPQEFTILKPYIPTMNHYIPIDSTISISHDELESQKYSHC